MEFRWQSVPKLRTRDCSATGASLHLLPFAEPRVCLRYDARVAVSRPVCNDWSWPPVDLTVIGQI